LQFHFNHIIQNAQAKEVNVNLLKEYNQMRDLLENAEGAN
jgi:hypothetical protein